MALPCERHWDVMFRVFSYLKAKHNLRLVLNLSYLEICYNVFRDHYWSSMHRDVKEAILPDGPTAHGKEVDIHLFVDSDHSDKFTHCSCIGFFIFLNSALIMWKSKKQPTIGTFCLWCRVCCHETQYGNALWFALQITDDGCTLVQAILYLQ